MLDPRQSEYSYDETVKKILEQLQDAQPSDNALTEASALAAVRQLRYFAKLVQTLLSTEDTQSSPEDILPGLYSLTRICDLKFVTYTYSEIPVVWRSLYVDTQLLKACCALSGRQSSVDDRSSQARSCIRDLDLALIVAGAASLSKGEPCQDLISALQTRLLALEGGFQSHSANSGDRPQKRLKTGASKLSMHRASPQTQANSNIVEYSFENAPSFVDLSESGGLHCSHPFIIRSYAQSTGWPAVQSGSRSWSSTEHLLRAAGPARIVPIEVGANYTREGWGQDIMLWSEFLRRCGWNKSDELGQSSEDKENNDSTTSLPVLYMAQHDLASQFPALEDDFTLPDYVYMSPPPTKDWPDHKPPATPNGLITNLWIGPAGTVSPPHFDPYYNCFVQPVGYKEVWVAPPHCCPQKVTSVADDDAGTSSSRQSSPFRHDQTHDSVTETLMANTANIDVFVTTEEVAPTVRAAAAKAVLGPGDLLFMPPGWWHSLRSLTPSFSVSTWF